MVGCAPVAVRLCHATRVLSGDHSGAVLAALAAANVSFVGTWPLDIEQP